MARSLFQKPRRAASGFAGRYDPLEDEEMPPGLTPRRLQFPLPFRILFKSAAMLAAITGGFAIGGLVGLFVKAVSG